MSAKGNRAFIARGAWALLRAHVVYWSQIAPIVRRELRRWETRAGEIPDVRLRGLAAEKLVAERFNVEVAAMIATTVPAEHRRAAVEAIVALQVLYDYLDALTEQPTASPIRDGLQASKAFTDAVTAAIAPSGDYYAYYVGDDDAGYLLGLAQTVHTAINSLPAAKAVADPIAHSSTRCAEAQVRAHAVPSTGRGALERWARAQAKSTELEWREWLFGAMGSVVAVHALIALAANTTATPQQAQELDDTYLTLCVLTTALDHLVDYDSDIASGEPSYIDLYESQTEFNQQLATTIRWVLDRTRSIPNGAHHLMLLSGVVAFYTSQAGAMGEFARPVTEHIRDQLRPLITPTLASLRAWRLAKRARQVLLPL